MSKSLYRNADEVIESAALALGESRLAGALAPLQQAYAAHTLRALRKTFLLAMAMLRRDEALEFLFSCLENESVSSAEDALSALALYRNDTAVRERVAAIVGKRDSDLLKRVHRERWGS